MNSKTQYIALAESLSREAGVLETLHQYFTAHQNRLWKCWLACAHEKVRNLSVLEIGPFYSYTPFLFRDQGNRVCVFEGTDPAIEALRPLYLRSEIPFLTGDLLELLGSSNPTQARLPYADASFDLINCWETMEHLNFNPLVFTHEMHRILKPGGRAFVSVPNLANLPNRLKLLLGRPILTSMDSYVQFHHYDARFLGFHWREYVLKEFEDLFRRSGFEVIQSRHLATTFHSEHPTFSKSLKRILGTALCCMVPSFGNLCLVEVQKP